MKYANLLAHMSNIEPSGVLLFLLNYLIDNIFVEFGGWIFQQTVGIPIGTNCALLLADLFLYSYEAEFLQSPKSRQETPCTAIQFHLQIYR